MFYAMPQARPYAESISPCPEPGIREITLSDARSQFSLPRDREWGQGLRSVVCTYVCMLVAFPLATKGAGANQGIHSTGWIVRTLLLISAQLFLDPTAMHVSYYPVDLFLHWWVGKGWWSNNRVSESNESLVSSTNFPQSLLMPRASRA